MLAQQLGLQVTGNNIANAQNPEYSRQRIQLGQGPYQNNGTYFLGSGVEVETIKRMRNEIYDGQYWQENATLNRWDTESKYATLLEGVFNDISGKGLSQSLDEFWNAWNELANHPEDPSMRRNIRMRAQQLVNTFHRMDSGLRDIKAQAKRELQASVARVNQLLDQLAQMNKNISANSTAKGQNNTLLDERDALINELSNYLDVTVSYQDNGTVSINSSYHVLVDQNQAFKFSVKSENVNGEESVSLMLYGNQKVQLSSGKLRGLTELIQNELPEFLNQLDQIASGLIAQVNGLHEQFYTLDGQNGISFFDPNAITAGTINLSSDILNDVGNIAVSKNGQKGDGEGGLAIFQLRDKKLLNDGLSTINEAYSALLGQVGEFSQRMNQNLENQTSVVNMIENQRQATMGVNLEEEFVNMIRYQQAFGAATKIISSVDEMMQSVLAMVR